MLILNNVHSYYGKSHILQGVQLQVQKNQIATLLGRNGAGKTTTLKTIMGLIQTRDGEIIYKDKQIMGLKSFEIARGGIGYVPEDRKIFSDLTVVENLEIASKKNSRWNLARIFDMFPRLEERGNNKGKQLSGGEQQMLAIARALVNEPDLLLLDEPSQGLAPLIVNELLKNFTELRDEGVTILLVEQNLDLCLKIADHHHVIDQGKIIFQGSQSEFFEHPEIKDRYLSLCSVENVT